VLLLNECLLLFLFILLSTQSGNFWIHPCIHMYTHSILMAIMLRGNVNGRDVSIGEVPDALIF
jgi:hypothetical protein